MLFKTIDEFKAYVPVNVNFTLENISPYIKTVERDFLSTDACLGSSQYTNLEAAYQASSMSSAQTNLLPFAQEVVACFAFVKWMPTGQVQISDVGIRINSDENQKTAFQWQIQDLMRTWAENGYSAQEALLKFLADNSGTYTLWSASSAFDVYKEFLFSGADDFQKYFNIRTSRRTYAALAASMRNVESLYIVGTIGDEYLAELKGKFFDDTLTDEDNAVIGDIKSAIAHLCIFLATKNLICEIAGDGIVINSYLMAHDNSIQREPAKMEYLKRLEVQEEKYGLTFLQKVKTYLDNNASETVYATYFGSGLFVDPDMDDPNAWVNSADLGQVVI